MQVHELVHELNEASIKPQAEVLVVSDDDQDEFELLSVHVDDDDDTVVLTVRFRPGE